MNRQQLIGEMLYEGEDGIASLAFSPDGKILAAGQYYGTITLWDVATMQPIDKMVDGTVFKLHTVTFSPDGKTLAVGYELCIILWDIASRQPIGEKMFVPRGGTPSVAFNPDGKNPDHGKLEWRYHPVGCNYYAAHRRTDAWA